MHTTAPTAHNNSPASPASPLTAKRAYHYGLGLFAVAGAYPTWGALAAFIRLCGVNLPAWIDAADSWIEASATVGACIWLQILNTASWQSLRRGHERLLIPVRGMCLLLALNGILELVDAGDFTKAIGHLAQLVLLVWLALTVITRSGVKLRELGIAPRERTSARAAPDSLVTIVMLAGFSTAGTVMGLLALLPGPQLHGSQDAANGLTGPWMLWSHQLWSPVVEELIVTGAIVALLAAAGRPTAECLLVSALMRAIPHLYLGWPALATFLVGIACAGIMLRYGRVLPLIAAHIGYNLLLSHPSMILPPLWQFPFQTATALGGILAALTLSIKAPCHPVFSTEHANPLRREGIG